MSRIFSRLCDFLLRIFSRNRQSERPKGHSFIPDDLMAYIQYADYLTRGDYGDNQQDSDTQAKVIEDQDDPGSVNESLFNVVKRNFLSQLAYIRNNPERREAVRETREFKLCLQYLAYRKSVWECVMQYYASDLKHSAELARLRFFPPFGKDRIDQLEVEMNKLSEWRLELTKLMDQARDLGLSEDVNKVTRAAQLNLEIRRLMSLAESEGNQGRWDMVLQLLVRSIHLLAQRNEAWTSWPELDQSRQEIMEVVELYQIDDQDCDAEGLMMLNLLHVSYSFLPTHAAGVCKVVNFHNQYLDQELNCMSKFIIERSEDSYVHAVGRLMAAEDTEFCDLGIELFDDFKPPLPTHRFGLRLYRLCLRMLELDLADTVMKLRFIDDPDKQEVIHFLKRLQANLHDNPPKAADRITLTEDHSDSNSESEYKLPMMPAVVQESHKKEAAWWVDVFKKNDPNFPSVEISSPGKSASCAATTVISEPSSSSIYRRVTANRSTYDPVKENRDVARLFIENNIIPDGDTYNILFSYVDDISVVGNPISLTWKGDSGVNNCIKTNIASGVPYHCRTLTYDPIQDQWSVKSDVCRISGPLAATEEGATCVPFIGDCGECLKADSFVFKIRKSRSERPLRDYMADARTQSTALWYVNRFRELTQDKFGVLIMLYSDIMIVYKDCHGDVILELMTREDHYHEAGSAVRFDKYTNNTKYINRKVRTDILEALSHFSHHDSSGTLMVTDLQGWVSWSPAHDKIMYTLTDPVIHCPGVGHRFGWNNRRSSGIDMFFKHVHPTCNHICQFLSLTRPDE